MIQDIKKTQGALNEQYPAPACQEIHTTRRITAGGHTPTLAYTRATAPNSNSNLNDINNINEGEEYRLSALGPLTRAPAAYG